MLMPSVFYDDLFNIFDSNDHPVKKTPAMNADVREGENDYILELELPGFTKSDISLVLEDGYLTIKAESNNESKTEDNKYKYIRKERCHRSMQRSFYVGDNLTDEDIKAGFNDGILEITIPKKPQEVIEKKHYIPIG